MEKESKLQSKIYEERIIIFIDILGFKALVDSTIDRDEKEVPEKSNIIKNLLEIPNRFFKEFPEFCKSKVVTRFSDTIVISFHYQEKSEVFFTLLDILHLHLEFLNQGAMIRGSVCFGKVYHNLEMIFGPGLVKAYEFESKVAIYPRIILDKEIIEIGSKHGLSGNTQEHEKEMIKELLEKDADGYYYIDYFSQAQGELNDPEYDFPNFLVKIREIIEKGLKSKDIGVSSKFNWMKEKYNRLIYDFKNPNFIRRLEERLGEEFAAFYENLDFL